MAVNFVPKGYQQVIPYLIVKSAEDLITFTQLVFKAEVKEKMIGENGRVMHLELQIGDSVLMAGEEMENFPARATGCYVYIPDVDEAYQRAIEGGATSVMPPTTQFYGDRTAYLTDSQENIWYLSTHVEEVSPEEMEKRAREQGN